MKNLTLLTIISAVLLTAATLIGCSNDVTPREGAIQGKITNLSGKAIKDVLVEWQYDNTRWGITDENGEYYIDGVGFGEQYFIIKANGYRDATFLASVYSGKTTKVNKVSIQNLSFAFSDIKVEKTTATTALISWKTSDYTNSIIEYGLTETLGKYARETEDLYTTKHSFEVINLEPEKTYYFRISANRKGQSVESSKISTFSTLSVLEDGKAPNPPTGVETALNGLPGQVVLFWRPNQEADLKGYKIYRSEVSNGHFKEVTNGFVAPGQERFTDTSVVTGKKYFYHVTAIDRANNESGFNNVADIVVPGHITTEVRWTVANSPYIIKGDLNITEFGVLHIDSGVNVLIESSDGLRSGNNGLIEINVEGAIAALGDAQPITIASTETNPSKSAWQGISFKNVTNVSNTMSKVKISDANTAISLDNSTGNFSGIEIINCNTGVSVQDCPEVTLDKVLTKRCTLGVKLENNGSVSITDSTFVHPKNCITSYNNSSLSITGCNMLEYTDTAIISEESEGIVQFINNLFVSPTSLALRIDGKCQRIANSVFDSPYAIQIKSEVPIIEKNLFMAERSIFNQGKVCIEYKGITPPTFGPNNVEGFTAETAYVGCVPSDDSMASSDLLLVKDITGSLYDYRLKQPFPSNSDLWGIIRESNPYEE